LKSCAGASARALAPAQDFKRVADGDRGANTGGMGAFAPMASMTNDQVRWVQSNIVEPTVRELNARGIDFRGVLYAGLMLTASGPKLLEYNVRFGDPEAEVLIPLVSPPHGLYDQLLGVATGSMDASSVRSEGSAVTVVLASHGYPESPRLGDVIDGLGDDGQLREPIEGVTVFHAGTRRVDDGAFVTAGGRVLAVTGVADTLDDARRRAYEGASLITFEGKVMRTDIARVAAKGER